MREIFQRWNTPRLRGHLVWIPMLAADDLDAAIALEVSFQNERVNQYWDDKRALGRLVSSTLKLAAPIAWDIYLLYLSGASCKDGMLPTPDFWMHQLKERSDLLLDPDRLMSEIQQAIEAAS